MKVYYAVIFLAVLITDYVGAKDKDGNTKVPEKYLITNNSVGYFKIGGNWMEIAEKEYKYDFVEGYGICIDGCCSGGYGLGKQIVIEKDGNKMIDSLHLIIVTQGVEENKVIDKNDKSIFFVESDNCPGWYYKDKIDTIMVMSDLFKTKEGIKVGSRL
ncbi:MAG: hypothetical protein N2746_02290, partial [Deltaproteobacteria bacterium]|nr:hypothetical protein [Deltaproteobacteria bacterium]